MCGLSLDGVSEIVVGESVTAPEILTRPNGRAIRIGVALFIFGTVLGLANIIVRDLNLFPEIYGKEIFLAFVIAGLLSIGMAFLFPKKVYKKRKKISSDVAESLNTGPLDAQLPPAKIIDADISFPKDSREHAASEPASVTENTTRQLS